MLEMSGHEVDEASDGEEGLENHRNNRADLIITDIRMPIKDGIETIRELRLEDTDVKVMAMAGHGEHAFTDAGDLGFDRAFEKPFKLREVVKSVNELLGLDP
jgi:DNA-binding response OmpR family regulator